MATTTKKATTARKPAARKPAARKAAATTTVRKTAAAKAQPKAAVVTSTKTVGQSVSEAAEKALLIPVGAVLTVRDGIVELVEPFTSRTGVEKELRKFERRGSTARNGLKREFRKNRTKAERELRKQRTKATREIKAQRTKAEKLVKSTRGDFGTRISEIQDVASKRFDGVEGLVQARISDIRKVADDIQKQASSAV